MRSWDGIFAGPARLRGKLPTTGRDLDTPRPALQVFGCKLRARRGKGRPAGDVEGARRFP